MLAALVEIRDVVVVVFVLLPNAAANKLKAEKLTDCDNNECLSNTRSAWIPITLIREGWLFRVV